MCCSKKSVEVIDSSSRYPQQQGKNSPLYYLLENHKESEGDKEEKPKTKSGLMSKAEKAEENGNYPEAILLYKSVINDFPEEEKAYMNLGQIYMKLRLFNEGANIFEEAIEVKKTNYIFNNYLS